MPQLNLSDFDLPDRHLQTLKGLLATHTPLAQVWAYGSRVTGHAHEGSDLDLVLRHPTDLFLEVEGVSQLKEALQNSNLPYLVDVHHWQQLPPAFHHNIETAYIEIQAPQK
jgi:predicted nucleotidyltransferase